MKYILSVFIVASLALFTGCSSKSDKAASEPGQSEAANDKRVMTNTYCNEKYKFCITFPEGAFTPQGELENGAGQEFVSEDGKGKLRVALGNRDGSITEGTDIKKAFDADSGSKNYGDISSKSFATTSYTLIGIKGTELFYQKTIVTHGVLVTAILSYENEVKDTFYPMIAPTFKSFK